jgi:hypothetical protein
MQRNDTVRTEWEDVDHIKWKNFLFA